MDGIRENQESGGGAYFHQRLDRIESKIDSLSEAIISIARVEQQLVNMEKDRRDMWTRMAAQDAGLDSCNSRLQTLETGFALLSQENKEEKLHTHTDHERISELEKEVNDAVKTIRVIHRLFWIGLSTFAAVYTSTHLDSLLS